MANGVTSAALARRLARERDVEYAVVDERAASRSRRPTIRSTPPASPATDRRSGSGTCARRAARCSRRSTSRRRGATRPVRRESSSRYLDTGVRYDHPDLLPRRSGGKLLPGYDMVSFSRCRQRRHRARYRRDRSGRLGHDGRGEQRQRRFLSVRRLQFGHRPIRGRGQLVARHAGLGNHRGDHEQRHRAWQASGRNLRVLPVRVLGKCGGYDSDIIAGMRWAAGSACSRASRPTRTSRA